jgi:hypothetical protein
MWRGEFSVTRKNRWGEGERNAACSEPCRTQDEAIWERKKVAVHAARRPQERGGQGCGEGTARDGARSTAPARFAPHRAEGWRLQASPEVARESGLQASGQRNNRGMEEVRYVLPEKAPHAMARGVRRRQGSHRTERRVGVYRPPPKWRGSPVSKHPVRETIEGWRSQICSPLATDSAGRHDRIVGRIGTANPVAVTCPSVPTLRQESSGQKVELAELGARSLLLTLVVEALSAAPHCRPICTGAGARWCGRACGSTYTACTKRQSAPRSHCRLK